jgi:hypothetical protein
MDVELILAVLRAFAEHGVRYRVVGGVALNIQGLARATVALDVFVSPDDENVARLRSALHSVFGDPEIDRIRGDDLRGQYPAIQYVPPQGAFHIDILARLGEAFRFEDIESEELDVDGIPVQVATPRMLYRMKKDTVRLQDRADADRLRRHYHLDEED